MFIMQMSPLLSHGLMTMDWLFLRLFNAAIYCNVRLLWAFLTWGVDEDEVLFSAREKFD